MSAAQKKKDGLPRSFPQDIFFQIHAWYGQQPTQTPPLAMDWLSTENNKQQTPTAGSEFEVPMPFTNELDDERGEFDLPPLDEDDITKST